MIETIDIEGLKRLRAENQQVLLVDVRSASEYGTGHIPGAMNVPLEQVESRVEDLGQRVPIILTCKSGQRARMAAGLLEPCRQNAKVLGGGTDAWGKAGLPLVTSIATRWSLERQVRLGAGLMALSRSLARSHRERLLAVPGRIRRARTHRGGTHGFLSYGPAAQQDALEWCTAMWRDGEHRSSKLLRVAFIRVD